MEGQPGIGWGWAIGRYFVLLFVVTGLLLFIDPNYFDLPLGSAQLGMDAKENPTRSVTLLRGLPFATAVTVEGGSGDPIEIVLGSREPNLAVEAEMTDPNGQVIWNKSLRLDTKPGQPGSAIWQSFLIGATEPGTYTLKVRQNAVGKIKVYFFQGPFVARMIILPIGVLLLSLIFSLARPKTRPMELSPTTS